MEQYSLSGSCWRLKGVAPNVPLQGNIMETGRSFRGLTPWMECRVPGGVAPALYRAGWLEHPYFGMNSLKAEWVEHRWWMFETNLSRPELRGERIFLRFLGVDYDAFVYLNNQLLGEHVGMFEEFSCDITEIFRSSETLTLRVLIKDAPDEVAQVGRTSDTTTQKSRFGYKWDFGTRLVNLGIWRDVLLVAQERYALSEPYVSSDMEGDLGLIRCSGKVIAHCSGGEVLRVEAVAELDGIVQTRRTFSVANGDFAGVLEIPQPALWYPNGRGKQPLYRVRLTLLAGEEKLDSWQCSQGVRRLRFLQNENAPAGALPYTYEVNGEKIYIKGVNFTPLDHIYGDIPDAQYEASLEAAAAMGVNLIRVWGGGIIEDERFYDLCDRLGILVWQEFIQSSSGMDNVPSKHPEFLELLEKTARCALLRCRNHTSLAAWSGGNELMDEEGVPAGYGDRNIAMLARLCRELCPDRFFYPTSASGPNERQSKVPDTSHDVHGDWEYGGNPGHYPAQAEADHLFNSEFGCSGVTFPRTARKVLPPQEWKPANMRDNALWRFKGDWWCTYERDWEIFGPMETFPEFSSASQWMQAEAVRYTVEANRRRAFRNSGSIIWQFNEPWPNVANTCLFTYYQEPKMAYFWAKHAYAPYHVSLDYRRLDYRRGENFRGDVWLSREAFLQVKQARIAARVLGLDGQVLYSREEDVVLEDGRHSSLCMALNFPVPNREIFAVRVSAESPGHRDETLYYFSTLDHEIYRPYRNLPQPKLEVALVEKAPDRLVYSVANRGAWAALHIHAQEKTDCAVILPEEDFFTLFPGESRTVTLHLRSRFNFGFDEYPAPLPCEPEIIFRSFPVTEME